MIDLERIEAERRRIQESYLRPEIDRPPSAARGMHHVAFLSSDVERVERDRLVRRRLPGQHQARARRRNRNGRVVADARAPATASGAHLVGVHLRAPAQTAIGPDASGPRCKTRAPFSPP